MGEVTELGTFMRKRNTKKLILITIDACLITTAYLCAIFFRYYMEGNSINEIMGLLFPFKLRFLLALIVLLIFKC